MHTDENKKFDKRNIERNIKNGIITQKDYEIYLSKLPDVSDKLFDPEEFSVDSDKFESTHSTPRSEARGMLRVDTERRFLPRFKNRGLAPSNVSKKEGEIQPKKKAVKKKQKGKGK